MPFKKVTSEQRGELERLLGLYKPLSVGDRCGVFIAHEGHVYGVIKGIHGKTYTVLLDGRTEEEDFHKDRVTPERSDLVFAVIATMTGVGASTVTMQAFKYGIKPPLTKGMEGIGRPKGEGKKFSPNRARVLKLWDRGKGRAPVEIAAAVGITPAGVRRIIAAQKEIEAKILGLSKAGVANAEIAEQLRISEDDVVLVLSVEQQIK